MSENEFDLKLKHIEEQFQAKREGALAWRDQEIAKLFDSCDWTQEQIAERVSAVTGKRVSQQYVSYRLIFGRFLSFTTNGCKDEPWLVSLTERRFREQWQQTKGSERDRFEEVALVFQHGVPKGEEARAAHPGISKAVRECLESGAWQTVEQIKKSIGEELPGVSADQVRVAIRSIKENPPAGQRLEAKKFEEESKKKRYRLARHEDLTPLEKLRKSMEPLLQQLEEIGKMHEARMSPVAIAVLACRLRRALEAAMQEEQPSDVR